MSKKDKKLYNYVVNTLGVSKQVILDYVQSRVDDLLSKALHNKLDSNYIQNLILNRITSMVENGTSEGTFPFYEGHSFDNYVKKCIKRVIEEKVNEDYNLEVKIVRKDKVVLVKI